MACRKLTGRENQERESDPLFFADFMAEAGAFQCDLCGACGSQEELRDIPWDAPGQLVRGCAECREGMAWEV